MLEEISAASDARVWDVCVVGTGPVGMALALEFERLGRTVLVLEAGGDQTGPVQSEASRAQIVDKERHAPMEIAVVRALGGTSWTWGGRCVAYDDVDFLDREFVQDAHWPIAHDEVRLYYKRAAEYLLCGSEEFAIPSAKSLKNGLTLDHVERWARQSRVILHHRELLFASKSIKLALRATVTSLYLGEDGGRIEALTVITPAGKVTIRAKNVILAMGGVETTRLLLATQAAHPHAFGGLGGPLGRYYMGHLSGKIADIILERPGDIADLDFFMDEGVYVRRRFMLTAASQIKHGVLNTAFWPDNPPFYNPAHGSGVLSAVFLALAVPFTGRKLVSEGIRLAHTGPRPYKIGAHLRNAVLGAPRGGLDLWRILRDRFLRKPRKPGFLVRNKAGRYALHYHAEQIPHPESRITLAKNAGSSQIPRVSIDLKFFDQDIESVIRSHELLDEALRANGVGRLEYRYDADALREKVWSQAADGYHQVGTTRMGDDPATSVVDRNLRVHGVEGLYVASSSVFPTTGQANSTFLAVALAVRLAGHLNAVLADGLAARRTGVQPPS